MVRRRFLNSRIQLSIQNGLYPERQTKARTVSTCGKTSGERPKKLSRKEKKEYQKRHALFFTFKNGKTRPITGDPPVRKLMVWGGSILPRRVGYDKVGDCRISTVFLGVNHDYFGRRPILFETMLFGGKEGQCRYCTYKQALKGHRKIVEMIKQGCSEDWVLYRPAM